LVQAVSDELNCKLPFEIALTLVKDCPYSWNGNGNVMGLEQSSQLDPATKVLAGTIVAPVEEVTT
jgi:hypothetical protein